MPSSALVAKQLDVRAGDFASTGSTVSISAYDSSATYSFVLPSSNPKWLNGTDDTGGAQVADQVLSYDVALDKYVWKQSTSSEVFLQGQTTSIGTDENGSCLTVLAEERVVAGDPLFDPSLPADQQVFKVTSQFTDSLYNMNNFTAGKAIAGSTYEKTTGVYFSFSDASVNPGGSTDDQKQAKDVVTLTTKKLATGSEYSQVICKPTDVSVCYENAGAEETKMVLADKTITSRVPGTAAETTMVQKPSELKLKFGGDDAVFKVDNSTKKMETDMSCIEFGESGSKHRLKVIDGKLYIQKYDSGTSKWTGAQVVIDQNVDFTATLTISSATVSGSDVAVTVALGGSGAHHWHVMMDDDYANLVHVAHGTLTHTVAGLSTGEHTVVAWPVDASHKQVGEKVTTSITI